MNLNPYTAYFAPNVPKLPRTWLPVIRVLTPSSNPNYLGHRDQ